MTARDGRSRPASARLGWLMSLMVLFAGGGWLYAQVPEPGSPRGPGDPGRQVETAPPAGGGLNPVTGELPDVRELFMTNPYINGVILALSVIAVIMFLFYLFTMNSRTMMPPEFVDDVTKLVLARRYEEAAQICRNNRRLFAASIIQRAVENAGKEHSVILDMLDSEGRRRADVIWNRLSYLGDIVNIAPMLGLLGTVTGMMQAFYAIRYQSISAESGALTSAIGGAMATTFFGLIVAIAALVFYSIVKGRLTRTLAEVEQVVHSIADHIKRGHA